MNATSPRRLNHEKLIQQNDLLQNRAVNLVATGSQWNWVCRPKGTVIPSNKPTAEIDDGLVRKESRFHEI